MVRAVCLAIPVLILLLPASGRADRRSFVWNYQARTMPAGALELEHYLTAEGFRPATGLSVDWVHQLELEFGITDRWDIGAYQVLKQTGSGPLAWDGYKVRVRGRFSDPGELAVDPLLYLEWKQGPDGFGFEEKLVLERRFGALILAVNLTAEQEAEEGGEEWEIELEPSVALGYEVAPFCTLGLEALYRHGFDVEGRAVDWTPPGVFAGPTLSFATSRFFWNLGGLYQLTRQPDAHPTFMVRSLIGVTL